MTERRYTEAEFYARVRKECDGRGYTDSQRCYVEITCAENGDDCGNDCWTVAINTLEMFIDMGALDKVAANKSAYD
ncbi:hypothetical protein [Rhizobium rhizogenes]|uniref:hypothetical protein n=1 Tax=Rhizobium rhizogenes TaxID=359 RepID=UPI0004D39624|nr:hypothetical protein [Rhizobium rhizogenes]KEA07495.1 hypothetical protein CN09_11360 [Rhizobium rhizogenes]NTJ22231.1 hypothetical protein [Rhizobium rhizogenes]QUE80950.1 hypothetical protein EML492_03825 [Rhizobium rhizogenes]TQO80944.1 hypothetical protein FFE80_07580 [Rhizobium rhizogenes]TRB51538.1 hypothetical protein EXN69_26465 [Rhizobium rhizogenes]